MEAVQELRQLGNRVEGPHDLPLGQHRAGPGSADGTGYHEAVFGEEMLRALLRVLADVIEEPEVAAGPEAEAPDGIAQGQLDGRVDGERAGGYGAQPLVVVGHGEVLVAGLFPPIVTPAKAGVQAPAAVGFPAS